MNLRKEVVEYYNDEIRPYFANKFAEFMKFEEERESPIGNMTVENLIQLIDKSYELNFKAKTIFHLKEIMLL